MKFLALLIGFIISFSVFAGGDYFDAKIISFKENSDGDNLLSFYQLNKPYGSDKLDVPIIKHVKIDFGCSQKLACFTQERTFSEQQHIEAIAKLSEIAKVNSVIQLGVISEGFVLINAKKNLYRSYGAFYDGNIVFLYSNSHL